jgi:Zn-dependent M28 family amino/carboxypeptidase
LRNIIGTLPGRKPAIVVGAHYDTLAKPKGFVGANNGAAGTALVIEVARTLQRISAGPEARKVNFVLFDGEEPPNALPEESPHFYDEGLRGSRAYASAHRGETSSMILLDYVGNRGLLLPREESSTPKLWSRVLDAAATVGASRYFSNSIGFGAYDDHSPFLRQGVSAVDLIDSTYPGHTLRDGLDQLSKESLSAVGETIVQLVDELRNE